MKQSDRQANGSITSAASLRYFSLTAESGMIVFSSPTQILRMNGPARSLMALFGESCHIWTLPSHESMPSILTEFCHDVLEQFLSRSGAPDWAQFEMRRVCHMVSPPLLICGFGVPNTVSQHPRVVVTLHRLGTSDNQSSAEGALAPITQGTTFSSHVTS